VPLAGSSGIEREREREREKWNFDVLCGKGNGLDPFRWFSESVMDYKRPLL
jgi:hypothetical protein